MLDRDYVLSVLLPDRPQLINTPGQGALAGAPLPLDSNNALVVEGVRIGAGDSLSLQFLSLYLHISCVLRALVAGCREALVQLLLLLSLLAKRGGGGGL